jgi:signal transduction histidine kinase
MMLGLYLPARLFGWQAIWLQSTLSSPGLVTLLLAATGPGYLLARVGVRLWLAWDRLRRQRMLWALTHSLLTLVVLLAGLGIVGGLLLTSLLRGAAPAQSESMGLLALVTERLRQTILPGLGIFAFMMALVLLVLLPPAALFSFWVARRTTRRLESLADTTQALRAGAYDARVAVVGEDEVAQLQADFNAMADELAQTLHDLAVQRDTVSQLLQARRELVASVSHELRTPVATLRALLESAAEGEGGGSQQGDLALARDEVLRLQALIDDLFALSRAEAGRLALDCRPTDLAPVIRRSVAALAPLAWKSGRVEVVADLPVDLPPACVDEARLQQVLANLLRNGIRHTPPGGIVAVGARPEAGSIVVEVRDTGTGITPEDLPRIWDRFYRGQGASGGAGLGLALVKELVEAMGGSVAVESIVGQGSYFTIRLPRA